MTLKFSTALILLGIFVAGAGARSNGQDEGFSLRKVTIDGLNSGQRTTSTLYVTSTRLREASSNGSDFVLLLDKAQFLTLDHTNQTYSQFSFEELANRIAEAKREAAASEQAKANAAMREQFQTRGELEHENLGDGGVIAGHSTTHHQIRLHPFSLDVWVAADLAVPDVYYESLKLRASANPFFDLGPIYEALKGIPGVSLKSVFTIETNGLKVQSTSEVTEVVRSELPSSMFEIPPGYEAKAIE